VIASAEPHAEVLLQRRRDIVEYHRRFLRSRTRRRPMTKTLADLFRGIELTSLKGSLDTAVNAIVIDSRRAAPGCLFFALPGLRSDGNLFVEEAIARGAVAVVSAKARHMGPARVAFLQVADPRGVLAGVARRFFERPDEALDLVGVTGTNGKSTVTHVVRHLLAGGGARVGLIGTISYDLGLRTVPSYKTTPESVDLHGMLAQMREAGCRTAVMEVSSHGIDQQRVRGMRFAAAAFTNLTRDHLDYHGGLEGYFAVKARLFTGGTGALPRVAAVNVDDPWGRRLLASVPAAVKTVTFGLEQPADVRASRIELRFDGTSFLAAWPGGRAEVRTHLLGHYNASNILCALAVCHGLGHDLAELLPRLDTLPGIPGRMERVENGLGCNVLVDYAHTDDALRNALGMLRTVTPGRVLVVFGCGGNRDRSKRPRMVAAVQELADFAWATADNPRKEPLDQIFADMTAGVKDASRIVFVDDRRRAISLALDAARPGDAVLIAGKGHEPFQEFGDTVITFDDRQVARELAAIKEMKTAP
jgi:UDP-N-acetylmuramoyl-L-alanyl-D-glutamate--2,6-diaminopimelate ligase